ncbi:unnamed protein product [Calypogeia fissa]
MFGESIFRTIWTELTLLCPHPPPGDGGGNGGHRARDPLLYVTSAVTAKDGSFRMSVNSTFGNILHRCVISLVPGSNSNCDLPPHSGNSIPMSTLKSSTIAEIGQLCLRGSIRLLPSPFLQQQRTENGEENLNAQILHADHDHDDEGQVIPPNPPIIFPTPPPIPSMPSSSSSLQP